MKFKAEIDIMPLKELLDPQGKAVKLGLGNLGIGGVDDVRVGKHITVHIEADTEDEAHSKVDTACKKLLSNLIMEDYSFQLSPVEG
ncbi:MAG TPA: phosphoribosylformylglycinamidine synthase [Cytophagales bacterium]|nr:phosphoribosylformylglycinamidine synthase [Cytophagales bacterium]HAA22027.1 phosphoribosylformylglycinamidine synthase [Cytophagales bacterium]HAP58602.1 phosphoribosylformylglycinamidine synthase [Cytophagales bacterium]